MNRTRATMSAATFAMIFFAYGGLAFGQVGGFPPGVNPSNPNDMTHLSNPNNMTLPGASNPHNLVRYPSRPQVVSPGLPRAIPSVPPVSSALAHTHIEQPVKKYARHSHHLSEQHNQ